MAANRYERGELFRRFRPQNRSNGDEIDTTGDNWNVES